MVKVQKGDTVTIKAMGLTVTGEVLYADFEQDYLKDDGSGNWDIELYKANVPGGYSHWKQRYDGGKLIEVNRVKVL